jgi:hypothetical protein
MLELPRIAYRSNILLQDQKSVDILILIEY